MIIDWIIIIGVSLTVYGIIETAKLLHQRVSVRQKKIEA